MLNKIIQSFLCVCLVIVLLTAQAQAQTCTPQLCVAAGCAAGTEETTGYKSVDEGFVEKLKESASKIMTAISAAETKMVRAIVAYSAIRTNLAANLTTDRVKVEEVIQKERQKFEEEQKSLEATQLAEPSENLVTETTLKSSWPATEALTRGMRLQLYKDHVKRVELEHEDFYSDKTNTGKDVTYNRGTISGIAKLYQTHKDFFCNPAGANKPSGCFDKGANSAVKMGDQMLEIYLGAETWPKEEAQRAIELMQFYLGMSPPDLPVTADFSDGEGQRAFVGYQSQLARNNFLTYILSYLVSKRAPTNDAQADIIGIRKEAADCKNKTADNTNICNYLNSVTGRGGKASRIELSKALEFDQFMNPAYAGKAISGTIGIEKDITMMMANRLQQDYEKYQMDKMLTASLAGYYAKLVERNNPTK